MSLYGEQQEPGEMNDPLLKLASAGASALCEALGITLPTTDGPADASRESAESGDGAWGDEEWEEGLTEEDIDYYEKLEWAFEDLDDALSRMNDKASSGKHQELVDRGAALVDEYTGIVGRLGQSDGYPDEAVLSYLDEVESVTDQLLDADDDDEYELWESPEQVKEREGVLATLEHASESSTLRQRYSQIVAVAEVEYDYAKANREWAKFALEYGIGGSGGGLKLYLATIENPTADAIASDIDALRKEFEGLEKKNSEEVGKERDELVDEFDTLRERIENLSAAGIPADALGEVQARLYHAVDDITPFYTQGRNMDLLEGEEQGKSLGKSTSVPTRTCNLTSLAMCLESLGKTAAHYDAGKQGDVVAAAEVFSSQVKGAKHKVESEEGWNALKGLRLPDFLQLAAVAEKMRAGTTSEEKIIQAAKNAWKPILSEDFLKQIAERFGVTATVKWFTTDTASSVEDQQKEAWKLIKIAKSNEHRNKVVELVLLRNAIEAAESEAEKEKLQKRYDRKLKKLGGELSTKQDEKRIALESYRQQMADQIGAELDSGHAVVVHMKGHYIRLQALKEDHVIVDDPAGKEKSNMKVTYEEARKLAYFYKRIVLK